MSKKNRAASAGTEAAKIELAEKFKLIEEYAAEPKSLERRLADLFGMNW